MRLRSTGALPLAGIRSQALLDQREHAEREEVDLDEPGVVAGILVPLAEVAALHRRGLDRHQVDERGGGDDHAADVLGDVAGEAGELLGQLDQVAPGRRVQARRRTPGCAPARRPRSPA